MKKIIIIFFTFSIQHTICCQVQPIHHEQPIYVLLIVDGKIPCYTIGGQIEFIANGNKITTECTYRFGSFTIEDENSIEILKTLPDTTAIYIMLDYYYFKRFIFNRDKSERIEQQYTFPVCKLDLFRSGDLIVAIKNNNNKTYEIALKTDRWLTENWNSKKMKKNRTIFVKD